ncbi:MAG: AbrB/MazE/SpoVT family DNA-binding domain-containing protein [Deltaproteobacteria bacterium]|nr:AbrB/MazE/SpoVT family DNA-binding domain-containing protein [Deltaproteobacteria bacterium]
MKGKLQKWGNSLALRIPKSIAGEIRLGQGSEVEISSEKDCLIVKLVKKEEDLKEILNKITEENLHEEVDFGASVGRETW